MWSQIRIPDERLRPPRLTRVAPVDEPPEAPTLNIADDAEDNLLPGNIPQETEHCSVLGLPNRQLAGLVL